VVVGFPGEKGGEFGGTLGVWGRGGFGKIPLFPLRKRDGTPAAAMANQVDAVAKKERVRAVMELGSRLAAEYRHKQVGTVREVLLERELESGEREGYTSEYIRAVIQGGQVGQVVKALLESLTEEGMRGRFVEM